jgi:hypothetical protein
MAMGHAMAMGHPMVAAPHGIVGAPHAIARSGAPVIRVSGGTRVGTVPRGTSPRVRPSAPGPARVTLRPRSTSPGTSSTAFNRPFEQDEFLDAPGLGFDEVHNRAVHPNREHRQNNDFGFFFPFFDGGFFLPSAPFVDETGGEAPPPEEVAAEEAPEPPHARTHYREQYEPPPPAASRAPEPPVKTEEYVFVRRDGTLFFAVAYTWDNGTLRYITSEGVRRSVTRDSIDLDATQQFNEQRGMAFHFPA